MQTSKLMQHDFVGGLDQRYQVAPCDNKRRMNKELMNMVDSAIDAGLKPIGIEPESFGQPVRSCKTIWTLNVSLVQHRIYSEESTSKVTVE